MSKKFIIIFIFLIAAFGADVEIASYNVENLFDCKNDGSEYKDFRVGQGQWNCDMASEKLSRIKEVILSINADIIALQEIENEGVLKKLTEGTEYKYVVFSGGKGAPVGLGLISKIKPLNTQNFVVPNVKTRNILKVNFELEGKKFSIFVNHFPAFKNGLSAQEKAERTLRSALENQKNAIVLGDFNTPFGSRSLLNDIIRTRGYVDLWEFMDAKNRYSHARGGRKSAIDHVLLSPEFIKNGELSYVYNSFEVYKPSFMMGENGATKMIDGKNAYSDHFPLKFKISTKPSRENASFFSTFFNGKDKEVKQTPALGSEFKPVSVDEIFASPKNTPFFLSRAAVVYKDKNGFVLAQNHRGIYVYDPQNDVELGDMLDVLITKTKIYKDALEVSAYEKKRFWQKVSPEPFMLPSGRLNEARAGDVLDRISGELKGGYLYAPQGKIRVYSPKQSLNDAKFITFEHVKVGVYNGEKQILVDER